MAKRFIDAEALAERMRLQYCKACDNYNGVRCGSCDIDLVCDIIEDAPEVDIAEVINSSYSEKSCKGCKYHDLDEDSENYYICEHCFRCYGYADNFKARTEGES